MPIPIRQDHELICSGCGCVLGNVDELHKEPLVKPIIKPSFDLMLLGSAIENNVKLASKRTSQQRYEERVLRQLIETTKRFSLPESLAWDTFNKMQKARRGFSSEKEPIKELIKIMSKDDNYLFIKKLNLLKKWYESTFNR